MDEAPRVLFFLPKICSYRDRIHMLVRASDHVGRLVLIVGRADAGVDTTGYPRFRLVDAKYRRGHRTRNLFRAWRLARRLIREERVNIVHDSFGDLAGLFVTKRQSGVRVYCSSLYTLNSWRLQRVYGDRSHLDLLRHRVTARIYYGVLMERFLARRADYLVFQTADLARRFRRHVQIDEDRIAVLPNSVDTGFWRPPDARDLGETTRLLTVGSIDGDRGGYLLLEAVRMLRDQGVPTTLTMVGRRGLFDTEEILRRRMEYGLENRVDLAGELPRDSVREAFHGHDILIYQTRNDASPRVVLEGLASGIPIVASRHPGIEPLDPNGEALHLTEFGDVEAIVARVHGFRADPRSWWERADRGREIAMRNHSSVVMAKEYGSWYESILT